MYVHAYREWCEIELILKKKIWKCAICSSTSNCILYGHIINIDK